MKPHSCRNCIPNNLLGIEVNAKYKKISSYLAKVTHLKERSADTENEVLRAFDEASEVVVSTDVVI